MVWTDQQKEVVLKGGAAPVDLPGVEAPCVVVRKDVFERMHLDSLEAQDGDLVDADYDVWLAEFEAFLNSMPPAPVDFDDSRESIYGDDRVP